MSHTGLAGLREYGKMASMKMEATSAAFGIGTLALINAGLAEQKGRSRLIWFLISLLTGPLATLLIVVLDRPDHRG